MKVADNSEEQTDARSGENARYWRDKAEEFLDEHSTGLERFEFKALAGQAVILVDWNRENEKHIITSLEAAGFPVKKKLLRDDEPTVIKIEGHKRPVGF
jgi:hypothetical protein